MTSILENAPVHDLTKLYHWCNERAFNNQLPNDIPCRWNKRLTATRGRMMRQRRQPRAMWIELSEGIRDHAWSVVNTMVHEMIHVWQQHMHDQTGDIWYQDQNNLDRSRGMNEGHGPAFFSEMERINQAFPDLKIDVMDDSLQNVRLSEKTLYGITMAWRRADGLQLHSQFMLPGKPTMAQRQHLHQRLMNLLRPERIQSIDLLSTRHQFLADRERITKAFDLRKNYALKGMRGKHIKEFIEHETTYVLGPLVPQELAPEPTPSYIDELNTVSNKLVDHRGRGLVSFAQLYCSYMPYLKQHGDRPCGATLMSGQCKRVPEEIVQRIREDWLKAKHYDIAQAPNVSHCVDKVAAKLGSKKPMEMLQVLEDAWMRAGPRRISRDDFAHCFEVIASDRLDAQTLKDCEANLRLFRNANDIMMADKVLRQGHKHLDGSYAQVYGCTVAAAYSANLEIDQNFTDKIRKLWNSPTRQVITRTRTFDKAVNTWGDMIRMSKSDELDDLLEELRGRFETYIAKFGGRVSRKDFAKTVMVTHYEQSPHEIGFSQDLEVSRNLLRSFEKEPVEEGQLALGF